MWIPQRQSSSTDTALKSAFVYTFALQSITRLTEMGSVCAWAGGGGRLWIGLAKHKGFAHAHAPRMYCWDGNAKHELLFQCHCNCPAAYFIPFHVLHIHFTYWATTELYCKALKECCGKEGEKTLIRINKFKKFGDDEVFICFVRKAGHKGLSRNRSVYWSKECFVFLSIKCCIFLFFRKCSCYFCGNNSSLSTSSKTSQ